MPPHLRRRPVHVSGCQWRRCRATPSDTPPLRTPCEPELPSSTRAFSHQASLSLYQRTVRSRPASNPTLARHPNRAETGRIRDVLGDLPRAIADVLDAPWRSTRGEWWRSAGSGWRWEARPPVVSGGGARGSCPTGTSGVDGAVRGHRRGLGVATWSDPDGNPVSALGFTSRRARATAGNGLRRAGARQSCPASRWSCPYARGPSDAALLIGPGGLAEGGAGRRRRERGPGLHRVGRRG